MILKYLNITILNFIVESKQFLLYFRLIVVPEQGLLYFILQLATHVVQAYAQAKHIVVCIVTLYCYI